MAREDSIGEDAALAERARAGDQAAFAELSRRYRPALLALAFDRTRNLDDADDLTQEALVQALEHIRELRDPASFPAWLRAIASNLCVSWSRQPCDLPLYDQAGTDDRVVAAAAIARCEQREIARALQDLPQANRLALLMHVWNGVPYDRIAAFLGVPVTTVEGRIFRAREQMRKAILDRVESLPARARRERPV